MCFRKKRGGGKGEVTNYNHTFSGYPQICAPTLFENIHGSHSEWISLRSSTLHQSEKFRNKTGAFTVLNILQIRTSKRKKSMLDRSIVDKCWFPDPYPTPIVVQNFVLRYFSIYQTLDLCPLQHYSANHQCIRKHNSQIYK